MRDRMFLVVFLFNAEFGPGEIEHLPMADASVDVVMPNCIVDLSPNEGVSSERRFMS